MRRSRVADQFVQVVRQAGVVRVYGVVGDSLNPLVDLIRRTGGHGACYQADLLVLLGTDFPYDAFLPQARTVQVDHDPTRLGRRTPLELAVHGDVAPTLRAVIPLVEQKVKGFAVAASKIVLTGGVGRMLDLARSNVRNIPRPSTCADTKRRQTEGEPHTNGYVHELFERHLAASRPRAAAGSAL